MAKETYFRSQLTYGIRHPLWALKRIPHMLQYHLVIKRVAGEGERLLVEDWDQALDSHDFVTLAHLHSYSWVLPYVQGLNCLDAGCGSGYGTHFLALNGVNIIGVDLSEKAIWFCQRTYKQRNNLKFQQMDVTDLKFPASCFDAVVSFEVLEHLNEADQHLFTGEVARVLKRGGTAYVGCPNGKKTALFYRNPFHLREPLREEFEDLLNQYFKDVTILGQDLIYGGARQYESRDSKVKDLSISNFAVFRDGYTFSLLSICKKPSK